VPSTAGHGAVILRGLRRIVKPQGLAPLLSATESGGLRIDWPTSGRVLGMLLGGYDPSGVLTADDAVSFLQIQVQINGDKNLCTNGASAEFAQFRALCPSSSPELPLDLPVRTNEPWIITVRNVHPSSTLVPEVLFTWREN
jgi:hypothetical protein